MDNCEDQWFPKPVRSKNRRKAFKALHKATQDTLLRTNPPEEIARMIEARKIEHLRVGFHLSYVDVVSVPSDEWKDSYEQDVKKLNIELLLRYVETGSHYKNDVFDFYIPSPEFRVSEAAAYEIIAGLSRKNRRHLGNYLVNDLIGNNQESRSDKRKAALNAEKEVAEMLDDVDEGTADALNYDDEMQEELFNDRYKQLMALRRRIIDTTAGSLKEHPEFYETDRLGHEDLAYPPTQSEEEQSQGTVYQLYRRYPKKKPST